MNTSDHEPPPILQPYLLVQLSVPFHVDAAGRRWIVPLSAKDLLDHTRYIRRLTLVDAFPALAEPALASPVGAPPVGARRLHSQS